MDTQNSWPNQDSQSLTCIYLCDNGPLPYAWLLVRVLYFVDGNLQQILAVLFWVLSLSTCGMYSNEKIEDENFDDN